MKLPEFDETQHIVRIDPVTQEGNEGIVHHHILFICPERYVDEDDVGMNFGKLRNYPFLCYLNKDSLICYRL